MFMIAAPLPSVPPPPAERLACLIDGLCKAVAAHGVRGLLTAPLLLLLWSRLRRMAVRARRLAARIDGGMPPASPPRPARRRAPSRPYMRLPRGLTWLVRAVPATACGAAELQFLLDDPRMAAVAEAPPMRRLLRPLCRMLGVRPPPRAAAPPAPAASEPCPAQPEPAPPRPPRATTSPLGRPAPLCDPAAEPDAARP
jgi:hypothetical protein